MMHIMEKGLYLAGITMMVVSCTSTTETTTAALPTPATTRAATVATVEEPVQVLAPAKVKYLKRRSGEAPYRNFHLDLTLTNRREIPVWMIMRYRGDTALPNDNMFTSISNKILQFASYKYDGTSTGGEGSAVQVQFIGKKKFIAYHMLPKSTLRIRDFIMPSQRRFKTLEIWEAGKIYVNSRTALGRWLPYSTFATKSADIRKDTQGVRLDMKEEGTKVRTDFPKGGVDSIWVLPLHKWNVDIDGI